MQNRIQALPAYLANQIAAGEVVERPASVLKELLENSLDAKSSQITIDIEQGGIGLIRIADNGQGIYKEDLLLAVTAHATSKISQAQDLEGIASLGFRGEALASIGSIARLNLVSRPAEQEFAWQLYVSGRGPAATVTPAAYELGTRIEIRDLFYNTPARRKFLKSEKTEFTYLEEVFKRIALSHFEVAFKFSHQTKLIYQLDACSDLKARTQRVARLTQAQFIEEALFIESEANGLGLKGWIGGQDYFRPHADLQFFFVNGRIVKDRLINHAIRQAYEPYCPPGRYPAYILYFDLDPSAIDVNVHPTKHEVRFREARTSHAFISHCLQNALNQTSGPSSHESVSEGPQQVAQEAGTTMPNLSFFGSRDVSQAALESQDNEPAFKSPSSYQAMQPITVSAPSNTHSAPRLAPIQAVQTDIDVIVPTFGRYKCLLASFLLTELTPQRWGLVDIAAAQSALCAQALSTSSHTRIDSAPLVIPQVLALSGELSGFDWERWQAHFETLGVSLSSLGPGVVRMTHLPQALKQLDLQAVFKQLKTAGPVELERLRHTVIQHCVHEPVDTPTRAEALLNRLEQQQPSRLASFFRQLCLDDLRQL